MLVTVCDFNFFFALSLFWLWASFYNKPLETDSFWELLSYVYNADVLREYVKIIILTKEIDI